MKVVYSERFEESGYAGDPAAQKGRIKCIVEALRDGYEFVEPRPASEEELKLIHPEKQIMKIKERGELLYELARLAAGASIEAAELAVKAEPSFALIRPPGHHASPKSRWGFCYFNNIGIAVKKMIEEEQINSAYVLDFDLHKGDGNINSLGADDRIRITNPSSQHREDYLEEIRQDMEEQDRVDIVAVSAGFDEHVDDWGGKLTTEDYEKIGEMLKRFSKKRCGGKRFALLEGGYNQKVLGRNVKYFLDGFKDG